MTKRPSISRARRLRIFNDNNGICHLCTVKIAQGQEWEVEHIKARAFKGSDDDENLRPAHVDCHKPKTSRERTSIAKADRAGKKNIGLKAQAKHRWNSAPPKERRPMIRDEAAHLSRAGSKHALHLQKMAAKGLRA